MNGIAAQKAMATKDLHRQGPGEAGQSLVRTRDVGREISRTPQARPSSRSFPVAIRPPRRIRIYCRGQRYYLLQWWEPGLKQTHSQRIDGDLIDAIAAARQTEECMDQTRRLRSASWCNCKHAELAQKYPSISSTALTGAKLTCARPIGTVPRSSTISRLRGNRPSPERIRKLPVRIGPFNYSFRRFRQTDRCCPTATRIAGAEPHEKPREFVVDVVRGLYAWAADPQCGDLLPHGFHNPFAGARRQTASVATDPIGEPDITVPMAVELLAACDTFQLSVFAPLLLYGLRPGELGWLFWGAR